MECRGVSRDMQCRQIRDPDLDNRIVGGNAQKHRQNKQAPQKSMGWDSDRRGVIKCKKPQCEPLSHRAGMGFLIASIAVGMGSNKVRYEPTRQQFCKIAVFQPKYTPPPQLFQENGFCHRTEVGRQAHTLTVSGSD